MAAYRADIEIGVKGIQQLQSLRKQIDTLSTGVDSVNKKLVGGVQSINSYNANLAKAAATLSKVNAGTIGEADAVRQYVQALGQANSARDRQNRLIQEQIALQRKAIATANAGFGIQGPALPPTRRGPTSPIGGATNIPGSPAAVAASTRRRNEAVSNAIIGGAFPLLFGQGLGAAAGGGIGGAAGGLMGGQFGFGLSLVGTALGAAVDTFTKAAVESGKSLNDPIKNFQKLADAGLLASRSQQKYIEQLIQAGRVTEAATLIQEEIIRKIGVKGAADLQNAGAASDKLNKALAELSLQTQAAVAGPLAALLSWLASVVAIGNNVNRQAAQQTDILQGLSTQDRTSLKRQEQQILQGATIFNEAQKRQQVQQLYQSYASRSTTPRPGMGVDTTPELQARGQTQELQAQVALEAKKLALVGMSLEKNGQAYVNAAKAVALQEYENKLLEIKNSWIGQAFNAERNQAMIRLANLQYAGKLKAISMETVKASRDELDVRRSLLGLQNELIQASLEAADLDVQAVKIRDGESAAITQELGQLGARLELEARALDFRRQQQLLAKDLTAKERSLIQTIYTEQLNNLKAQYQIRRDALYQAQAQLTVDRAIADAQAMQQARQPFEDIRAQRQLDVQYGKTYLRLVTEGLLPAEADRIANYDRIIAQQVQQLDLQIAIAEQELNIAKNTGLAGDALQKYIDALERLKKARGAAVTSAAQGPGQGPTDAERLQEAIAAARGELNELTDPINQVLAGARAIGDAFQQAFMGLVTGAMTGQQALAAFFKGVGDHFMDMASKMIAKLIEIYILETVLGFITGSVGKATPRGTPGAKAPNGKPYYGPAFAEGGFVTGPTRALIGEGGEPEYVIPASKMRGAMSRYAAGARGSSVIPSSGDGGTTGATATMAPAAIDVRYTVERINSVDYVTADQFQAGLRQAAQQGAEQGERRTLRRLQHSPATRRRVGV